MERHPSCPGPGARSPIGASGGAGTSNRDYLRRYRRGDDRHALASGAGLAILLQAAALIGLSQASLTPPTDLPLLATLELEIQAPPPPVPTPAEAPSATAATTTEPDTGSLPPPDAAPDAFSPDIPPDTAPDTPPVASPAIPTAAPAVPDAALPNPEPPAPVTPPAPPAAPVAKLAVPRPHPVPPRRVQPQAAEWKLPERASLPAPAGSAAPARAVPQPAAAQAGPADVLAILHGKIRAAVQAALRYPPAAAAMQLTGRAQIQLEYQAGTVRNVQLVHSAGSSLLDRAALAAVHDARYPPAPPEVSDRTLNLLVWVELTMT